VADWVCPAGTEAGYPVYSYSKGPEYGYVDEEEVSAIAHFISSLNPDIPYSLLAFYPQFYMHNLPTTSRSHAERCKKVAEREGLRRVRIGNLNLLSNAY